jgi:hypothetical protein
VETDKGHHYLVASWRGLRSWDGYRVAEGGSNATCFECQQSNGAANERHRARFSGRDYSIRWKRLRPEKQPKGEGGNQIRCAMSSAENGRLVRISVVPHCAHPLVMSQDRSMRLR